MSNNETRGDTARGHKQAAQELYAVLEELEWISFNGCLHCGADPTRGHKENCLLGQILEKYGEYGEEGEQ